MLVTDAPGIRLRRREAVQAGQAEGMISIFARTTLPTKRTDDDPPPARLHCR